MKKTLLFPFILILLCLALVSAFYFRTSFFKSERASVTREETALSTKEKKKEDNLQNLQDSLESMMEKASTLIYKGNKEEGVKILLKILALDSKNEKALEELGLYYLEEGQNLQKAKEYFETLYKVNPKNPLAITELVFILEELGGVTKAEGFLRQVYLENPTDPMLASVLAQILAKDGRLSEAQAFTDSALKYAQNSFELEDLAFTYYENKDFNKSALLFEKVLELKDQEIDSNENGQNSEGLFELARTKLSYAKVKFELGACEEALKIIKEISSFLKDDPSFLSFQMKVIKHC